MIFMNIRFLDAPLCTPSYKKIFLSGTILIPEMCSMNFVL